MGVWQRTAQATQGTVRLSRLATEVDEVQNRVVRSRAVVLRFAEARHCWESKRQQQSASATRGLAKVQ